MVAARPTFGGMRGERTRGDALGDLIREHDVDEQVGADDHDPGVDHDPVRRARPARVPLISVPESLRSVDLRVGMPAVRGILIVTVVILLVLGGRLAWAVLVAEPQPTTVPAGEQPGPHAPGHSPTARSPGSGDQGASTTTAPATPDPPARVVVHISGQVVNPGVVELRSGARVVDAVEAAGGLTSEADASSLNLARPVMDGEQVWVGRPGESPPASAGSPPAPGMPSPAPGGPGSSGAGQGGAGAPLLDLNTATQAQLEELPGIGPVTAGHILAWREANGRFSSVDELLEVSGIGERTLAQLAPLVTAGG